MEHCILFDQNQKIGGFMEGGYDSFAYQPTQTNWIRHSLIDGPSELKVQWAVKIPSSLQKCPPVIGRRGEVYFGSRTGILYCYSPIGEMEWQLKLGIELSELAVGADQRIYVAAKLDEDSDRSFLYAITPNAAIAWKCELDQMLSFPPILDSSGNIFVTTYGKQQCLISCINHDGTFQWSFSTDYLLSCSPVITSAGNILMAEGDFLRCIDLNGQEVWSKKKGSGLEGVPIILFDHSCLATGPFDGNMKLLKLNDVGECVRAFPVKEDYSLWGSPAVSKDGVIYISGSEYRLEAIDLKSETLLWESKIEGNVGAPPLISRDNKLIITSSGGNIPRDTQKGLVSKITLLNEAGEQISESYLPGEITSPCLGKDNKVYVTVNIPMKNHGYLYCIG